MQPEVSPKEDVPGETAPQVQCLLPKQLADVLIRSMMIPVERPATPQVLVPVDAPAASTANTPDPEVAPNVSGSSEEWDLPFDWTAPEELPEPEHIDLQPPESLTGTVPFSLAVPTPVFLQQQTEITAAPAQLAEPAQSATNAPTQTVAAASSANAEPTLLSISRPVPTTVGPLAFALKLTIKEQSGPQNTVPSSNKPLATTEPKVETPIAVSVAVEVERSAPSSKQEARLDEPKPEVLRPVVTKAVSARAPDSPVATETSAYPGGDRPGSEFGSEFKDRREPPQPERLVSYPKSPPIHPSAPVASPEAVLNAANPAVHAPVQTPAAVVQPETSAPKSDVPLADTQVELQLKPEIRSSSPAREIAVRISAPDASPVDLQVRERGGAVHVAVHSANGELQTSLRQDLGTLVDRLYHSGFHSEVVQTQESGARTRPEGPSTLDLSSAFRTSATAETIGQGNDRPQDGSNEGDNAGSSQNQDQRARQQQRRQNSSQQQHQKWTQAMEDQE
jgi:hypothetical protein